MDNLMLCDNFAELRIILKDKETPDFIRNPEFSCINYAKLLLLLEAFCHKDLR